MAPTSGASLGLSNPLSRTGTHTREVESGRPELADLYLPATLTSAAKMHAESAIPRQGRIRAAIRSVTRTLASALVSLIMSEAAVAAGVMRRRKTRPVG